MSENHNTRSTSLSPDLSDKDSFDLLDVSSEGVLSDLDFTGNLDDIQSTTHCQPNFKDLHPEEVLESRPPSVFSMLLVELSHKFRPKSSTSTYDYNSTHCVLDRQEENDILEDFEPLPTTKINDIADVSMHADDDADLRWSDEWMN